MSINFAFECGSAQIRAHYRHLATVVTVHGEIDAANADRISEYIRRFTLGEHPVVLDMGDVSHFAAAGISLLYRFDADCRAAGVEWTLVPSPAVIALLSEDDEARLPMTRSVHQALHDLAEAIANRRRLVLPLVKRTA